MIQGTGSHVGKSMLVAGLCRLAHQNGIGVVPFKPQNMSNNSAITVDGGEIGRAQALQARAAGLDSHSDMNPVLLKPETDKKAQVIVQGKRLKSANATNYQSLKAKLLESVIESYRRLGQEYDLILVEGAGSPAEVNLRKNDIANMGFAVKTKIPVVLVGDIDRGGVIAQIVGTHRILDIEDKAMISGFIINKFRGEPRLFNDGYEFIFKQTGWLGYGVLPWFDQAWKLPAEDAPDLARPVGKGALHVVCLQLSRVANIDDFDPLSQEPSVRLTILHPGRPIPGDADLVVIPGSKSTRGDLDFLRQQGWDVDLYAHYRRGGRILGICGGYQMLGQYVSDPKGVEGEPGDTQGLALLNVGTTLAEDKQLTRVKAVHAKTGYNFDGYEIHMGITEGEDCRRPYAFVNGKPEGAISKDGLITGLYLHGMFTDDRFRSQFLEDCGIQGSGFGYDVSVENVLDDLAEHMQNHLDIDGLFDLAS
ncbi:MAG: cobyric acid synthase [Gammaproteobacteria bacterium]|nr:cobyric acid synthase [Gammaproteobacteria bacterium]MCY4218187.1 cobyric acid synthase [Gammaproteobacteria bacterium]MCY4273938.1 cobyric acid synthase [Gammaproteobacteria bacterium]